MKKLPPLSIAVLCLNALCIAAGITYGIYREASVGWAMLFLIAPIFCFRMAWVRVNRAPPALPPSKKASIIYLVLLCALGAAGPFILKDNSTLLIAAVVYLFFSFSADIVVKKDA